MTKIVLTDKRSASDVSFDYINSQGRFEVRYEANGHLVINAYCLSTKAPADTDPMDNRYWKTDFSSCIARMMHTIDFDAALEVHSQTELVNLCRADFLAHRIQSTDLERPEQAGLPRVHFNIGLIDGTDLKVVLRSDGSGGLTAMMEWYDWQNNKHEDRYVGPYPKALFEHQVSSDKIAADAQLLARVGSEADSAAANELIEQYKEFFWEEINPGFSNSYLRSESELETEALSFINGSEEELLALMKDAARVDQAVWNDGSELAVLAVRAETDEEAACVDTDDGDNEHFSRETRKLVGKLLEWFVPKGSDIEYNDGSSTRWSGYSHYPKSLCVEVAAPSATERMEALERLISWSETQNIDLTEYLPK